MSQLSVPQAMRLAGEHYRAGRMSEAEAICRQVLAQQPGHADALNLLGVMARRAGNAEAAIDWLRRAIAAKPNVTAYYGNLGNALRDFGLLDEAVSAFRHCVATQPGVAGHHNNLGTALADKGQREEAISAYHRAIELDANYAEPHNNLGLVYMGQGRLDAAIAAYRRAITIRPDYAEARSNLAKCLCDTGAFDEAIEMLEVCLAAAPANPGCLSNLGNVLSDGLRLEEAIAMYRRALALAPDDANAHSNLALALLLRGDFKNGLAEYEWRWKCDWSAGPRPLARPQWRGPAGADIAGRTLLLHVEQGFGDAIQFIRYAPMAAALGARVVVWCWAPLARLLKDAPGVAEVVTAAPAFDEHCPLLSLPLAFGTTLETIPGGVPYLKADAQLAAMFARKVAPVAGLKVGLVWAGSGAHKHDRQRSITLAQLGPLARVPGVTFFSLQKGTAGEQATHPPPGMNLIDLTTELHDFADTAALISQLDLVIAVDTAVAHLAGAMGKPVWLLLPYAPDWRWLLGRDDSPWYPTARLFRQAAACQWEPVMQRMAELLASFVQENSSPARAR